MKIKNNKKNVVVLRFSSGGKVKTQKIKSGELIEIPLLKGVEQVVNKFLFKNGNLSVMASPESVIIPDKKETAPKKADLITKENYPKKSKIEEAIESADDFVAGDVNKNGVVDGKDLSIVHKDYSNNKKSKK